MEQFDVEVTSFMSNGKGLTENQVVAHIGKNNEFDRKPHPKLEKSIEGTWNNRLAENPQIFNASKFRLHSFTFASAIPEPSLLLEIGLTSYKDFLGTNCAPHAERLHQDGIKKYGNSQVYLSEALAIGGLVMTLDNKFVIFERSHLVSEARGLLDRPGGHPEPENTIGYSSERGLKDATGIQVVRELFQSTVDEIVDEVNVPAVFLRDVTLMGFSKNNTTGGRQAAEFLMKCDLTSEDIISRYTTGGHKEAEESVALYCWTEDELLSSITKPDVAVKMSIALRGAVKLYALSRNLN